MAREGKDDRKHRLAQALRTNLRLRKKADAGDAGDMLRREDRLEPRIRPGDSKADDPAGGAPARRDNSPHGPADKADGGQ